jgi:hypothetical protein
MSNPNAHTQQDIIHELQLWQTAKLLKNGKPSLDYDKREKFIQSWELDYAYGYHSDGHLGTLLQQKQYVTKNFLNLLSFDVLDHDPTKSILKDFNLDNKRGFMLNSNFMNSQTRELNPKRGFTLKLCSSPRNKSDFTVLHEWIIPGTSEKHASTDYIDYHKGETWKSSIFTDKDASVQVIIRNLYSTKSFCHSIILYQDAFEVEPFRILLNKLALKLTYKDLADSEETAIELQNKLQVYKEIIAEIEMNLLKTDVRIDLMKRKLTQDGEAIICPQCSKIGKWNLNGKDACTKCECIENNLPQINKSISIWS